MKNLNYLIGLQSKASMVALLVLATFSMDLNAQNSAAREWNEVNLEAIRMDLARPTVHSRNLFHTTAAMYDAWAIMDDEAETYLLGKNVGGYNCPFGVFPDPADIEAARSEAISHAAYNILSHRYDNSPGNVFGEIQTMFNDLMTDQGYDYTNTSLNYTTGDAAALGNYIGFKYINYGLQDGANEAGGYSNLYYLPVNPPLMVDSAEGNPDIIDPNSWQPLELGVFIDQSGNLLTTTPEFLGPEWGNVDPFSLSSDDLDIYTKLGPAMTKDTYKVYHDPGAPPTLDTVTQAGLESLYKWNFALVSVWGAHLDPALPATIDVSPANIGNNTAFPTDFEDYDDFYNFFLGGDQSQGYTINPATGNAYTPQNVPMGDYARILAEFWADGPDSETPPGHWFTLLNYVSDHPDLEKKWQGKGEILNDLEWDVKTYFTMGGTMHDAAIAAWGIKGYYDYIRPISAIRCMTDYGQCTDNTASNYHAAGIPLIPGYIETVEVGDPLAGPSNENVGEIKLYTWGGPQNITYLEPPPEPGDNLIRTPLDSAGVSWILADSWMPYQRPSFVTPPFAGYVSGHSTFSRAAAEVMTKMTGDAYFPGGMGEFYCEKDNFLVFEIGPSQDVTLQWATYRDASDQCSLSRIWGGIHPPVDDIPGRIIGEQLGLDAFAKAQLIMDAKAPEVTSIVADDNILSDADVGNTLTITIDIDEPLDTNIVPMIGFVGDDPAINTLVLIDQIWVGCDQILLSFIINDANEELSAIDIQITGAQDMAGNVQDPFTLSGPFEVDTYNPSITLVSPLVNPIIATDAGIASVGIAISFDDDMDTLQTPLITFPIEDPLANTLTYNAGASYWANSTIFVGVYDVIDANEELADIDIAVSSINDASGNGMITFAGIVDAFSIDMESPVVTSNTANTTSISDSEVGPTNFTIDIEFSKDMDMNVIPVVSFPDEDPEANSLVFQAGSSSWISSNTFQTVYDVLDGDEELNNIDIAINEAQDLAGNVQDEMLAADYFNIDTKNPNTVSFIVDATMITDANEGSEMLNITAVYDEEMDVSIIPSINWPDEDASGTLILNSGIWTDATTLELTLDVVDINEVIDDVDIELVGGTDMVGNVAGQTLSINEIDIEMENPNVLIITANTYNIDYSNTGVEGFSLLAIFNESMDMSLTPAIDFPVEDPSPVLTFNAASSFWINDMTYIAKYDVQSGIIEYIEDIDTRMQSGADLVGNAMIELYETDFFDISVDWTTTDVNEIGDLNSVIAYPNPVKSGERITIGQNVSDDTSLRIYSLEGKEIVLNILEMNDQRVEISTQGWKAGVYAIHIQGDDSQSVVRIVVN